jgi:hypothetical protein
MVKTLRNFMMMAAFAAFTVTQVRADDVLFANDKISLIGAMILGYTSYSPSKSVEVKLNSTTYNTQAGVFNLIGGGRTVCVELDQNVSANTNYTYQAWHARGRAGALIHMMDSFVVDNNTAAAFQLAMWEIAYDHAAGNLDDLSAQIFKYTSTGSNANTIRTLADGLLAATAGKSKNYIYLRHDSKQDWVMVPEPASMTALGAGLIGMLIRRKRKNA